MQLKQKADCKFFEIGVHVKKLKLHNKWLGNRLFLVSADPFRDQSRPSKKRMHEIQRPRHRYGIIDFKNLMALLQIENLADLNFANKVGSVCASKGIM